MSDEVYGGAIPDLPSGCGIGVWNLETGAREKWLSEEPFDAHQATALRYSPSGKYLAALGMDANTEALALWDPAQGRLAASISGDNHGLGKAFAFSADESKVAFTYRDGL